MSKSDDEREPTPEQALNALTNLLRDVLDDLTLVELYPKSGIVSKRFLDAGAEQAVCVTEDQPDDHLDEDGMIWLPMDPVDFMGEERVQDVGMIYSSPPDGADQNREIIEQLPQAQILQENCIIILEEPVWNYTIVEDYNFLDEIEENEYDRTRVTVNQMVNPMGV